MAVLPCIRNAVAFGLVMSVLFLDVFAQDACLPDDVPTGVPSCRPSTSSPSLVWPTSIPSSVPSTPLPTVTSSPTLPCYFTSWQGGSNDPVAGVEHTFTGLQPYDHLFLTVEVYQTDYDTHLEYISLIQANSINVSTYCDPAVECGSDFSTCVYQEDVVHAVESGSLTVTVKATEEVGYCPYNGFGLYTRITLINNVEIGCTATPSVAPSFVPSVSFYPTPQPTSIPSSGPSSVPSVSPSFLPSSSRPSVVPTISQHPTWVPSSIPSASPTEWRTFSPSQAVYCETIYQGSNVPEGGVDLVFTGVNEYNKMLLSVDVYETDFDDSLEYVYLITAGSLILSQYCSPNVACGTSYYSCISNADVTSSTVDPSNGDRLVVSVYATECVNICPYSGYRLFVRATLCSYKPSPYPTPFPVPELTARPTPTSLTESTLPGEIQLRGLTTNQFTETYQQAFEVGMCEYLINSAADASQGSFLCAVTDYVRHDGGRRLNVANNNIDVYYNIFVFLELAHLNEGNVFETVYDLIQDGIESSELNAYINRAIERLVTFFPLEVAVINVTMSSDEVSTNVLYSNAKDNGDDDELFFMSGSYMWGAIGIAGAICICAVIGISYYIFVIRNPKQDDESLLEDKRESFVARSTSQCDEKSPIENSPEAYVPPGNETTSPEEVDSQSVPPDSGKTV